MFYNLPVLQVLSGEAQQLVFTIPIFEPLPSQYYVRAVSDRWLGSQSSCAISFQHLILPERHPPHTGIQLNTILYILYFQSSNSFPLIYVYWRFYVHSMLNVQSPMLPPEGPQLVNKEIEYRYVVEMFIWFTVFYVHLYDHVVIYKRAIGCICRKQDLFALFVWTIG